MALVEVDFDYADAYVGDTDDGWYLSWGQGPDGKWFWSGVIDCNTGHFLDATLSVDRGPFGDELAAAINAIGAAMDWCCENEVETADFIHCLPARLRAEYEALDKEDEHEEER